MAVDMKTTDEQVTPVEDMVGDPLWSFDRMAKYMEVSVKQVRRWYGQRLFRAVRFGPKLLRVRRSEVETFINSRPVV